MSDTSEKKARIAIVDQDGHMKVQYLWGSAIIPEAFVDTHRQRFVALQARRQAYRDPQATMLFPEYLTERVKEAKLFEES